MAIKKNGISAQLQKNLTQEVYKPLLESHKNLSLGVGVIHKKQEYRFYFGPSYSFFDLASLTKPIFTMSVCMWLEDQNPGFINQSVKTHLPWFTHPQVKIKDLLSHQSAAPALFPVFEQLQVTTVDEGLAPLNVLLRNVDFDQEEGVYSDVGFFILGAVLEEVFNMTLFEIFLSFQNQNTSPLTQWHGMHFRRTGDKNDIKKYAPTEKCPLRNKVIQGEVHDESCWKMGGVSTHAGLFGGLDDVMKWVKTLNSVFHDKKGYSKKTIESFYKKQKTDWRLGMMCPSKPRSTAGDHFSSDSYGHLGFTGTSIWVDPAKDLSVVVLSNRTYPDRRINVLNQFRPHIHNIIAQTLDPALDSSLDLTLNSTSDSTLDSALGER